MSQLLVNGWVIQSLQLPVLVPVVLERFSKNGRNLSLVLEEIKVKELEVVTFQILLTHMNGYNL